MTSVPCMNCALMYVVCGLHLFVCQGGRRVEKCCVHFVGKAVGRDSFLSQCFCGHPLTKKSWSLPFLFPLTSPGKGAEDEELDVQGPFSPFSWICHACREPVLCSLARPVSFVVKAFCLCKRRPVVMQTVHASVSWSVWFLVQ